ncbi:DUF5689 domain-containing protein [Sphingobacterium sp. BN32]|uniref:DUF5689 domain-containing protein n=1 Tax=Sphingobacterium sp. BN32 TaxID=3058432 RepID=UPI00265C9599|nr:DUF5689 domain-containing protein [Sphingobacterium sp. BN32]WKK57326.1 DUF5689 domain-containing protein [Sphingobacterium sp. BN32]
MMKKIHILLLLLVALCIAACERDYSPPPLTEPKYTGKLNNISIKQLKTQFKNITAPTEVTDEFIIRGIVVGNDESGNIYKQIYIQDETAGLNIGIDQNAIYGTYQVGQEIFLHLKGLFMLKYGDELQLGMASTQANRIRWDDFQTRAFANSWPNMKNVEAKKIAIQDMSEEYLHQLVEFNDIRFVNGGKSAFITGDRTTNESIKDASGKTLDVRTSNYADFSREPLPKGKGKLFGVLGRFNGAWQLVLRTKSDIGDFDGSEEETVAPNSAIFFKETFGNQRYGSGNRPKINDFTDFDMKAPVKYEDASKNADIRSISSGTGAHIWLPANRDAIIKISGINSLNKGVVNLKYDLTANLFDAGSTANLDQIQIRVNGNMMVVPSKVISNAAGDNGKYYTIELKNLPQSSNLIIEFISSSQSNKIGFRLDNIELSGSAIEKKEEIIVLSGKRIH